MDQKLKKMKKDVVEDEDGEGKKMVREEDDETKTDSGSLFPSSPDIITF